MNLSRTYMSQIKNTFPVIRKPEREFLRKLKANVHDYCREHNPTSITELYEELGTPLDTVHNYYAEFDTDTESLMNRLNFAANIRKALICIALIVGICAACVCIYTFHTYEVLSNEENILQEALFFKK